MLRPLPWFPGKANGAKQKQWEGDGDHPRMICAPRPKCESVRYFIFMFGRLVWFSVFQEKVSPYNSPGCTGNHFVDQAGLELPALGSKSCATVPGQSEFIK